MSMPYQVMYRIGFTPWDGHEPSAPLVDLVGTLPAGQMLDIGCGGGLSDPDRRRAAATITAVAAPGARLLMFAFGQGGGRFGPRRLDLPEIRALFPAWDIMFSRSADEIDIKGPMRDAARAWHQLVRQPPAEATKASK